jgi:hypothetical protein
MAAVQLGALASGPDVPNKQTRDFLLFLAISHSPQQKKLNMHLKKYVCDRLRLTEITAAVNE